MPNTQNNNVENSVNKAPETSKGVSSMRQELEGNLKKLKEIQNNSSAEKTKKEIEKLIKTIEEELANLENNKESDTNKVIENAKQYLDDFKESLVDDNTQSSGYSSMLKGAMGLSSTSEFQALEEVGKLSDNKFGENPAPFPDLSSTNYLSNNVSAYGGDTYSLTSGLELQNLPSNPLFAEQPKDDYTSHAGNFKVENYSLLNPAPSVGQTLLDNSSLLTIDENGEITDKKINNTDKFNISIDYENGATVKVNTAKSNNTKLSHPLEAGYLYLADGSKISLGKDAACNNGKTYFKKIEGVGIVHSEDYEELRQYLDEYYEEENNTEQEGLRKQRDQIEEKNYDTKDFFSTSQADNNNLPLKNGRYPYGNAIVAIVLDSGIELQIKHGNGIITEKFEGREEVISYIEMLKNLQTAGLEMFVPFLRQIIDRTKSFSQELSFEDGLDVGEQKMIFKMIALMIGLDENIDIDNLDVEEIIRRIKGIHPHEIQKGCKEQGIMSKDGIIDAISIDVWLDNKENFSKITKIQSSALDNINGN